jgi:hypothetical protein
MKTTNEPVTDAASLQKARALLDGIVKNRHDLHVEWLANKAWVAVPVESASHFDGDDARRLAAALAEANIQECFAVATEELKGSHICYRVPATVDGLLAFSWECGSFNFALVSHDRSFVVLCTSDDYFLVAGSMAFVSRAVGGDLARARASFEQFAQDASWPAAVRDALLLVSQKYRPFDGSQRA